MIKRKNFIILILALSSMAFATKYEAEAATLSGGAKNVNASGVFRERVMPTCKKEIFLLMVSPQRVRASTK